ncbi:MAG: DUF2240 family protein [Candidatus Aenigmatarchaeota archaeon]
MLSLEEILEELSKITGFDKNELLRRIEKKQEELSGLVSMEGAAHLVARDLGIDLLKREEKMLQLKDIRPDMRNVNLKAKVISITPVREFVKKDGSLGKVRNLLISDGTSQTRIPLWDKQIEIADEINIGDVLELRNVSTKQNIFGNADIVLKRGSIIKKTEEEMDVKPLSVNRVKIKDASEGNFEIKATIVDIFNVNPIFYFCPHCKSRIENNVCNIHGSVEAEKSMVISGVIDDGSGVMRAVFFRDAAKEVSGLSEQDIENLTVDEAVRLIRENTVGKEFIFRGRIQKNKIFENLELVVNEVIEIDVNEEIQGLLEELGYEREEEI